MGEDPAAYAGGIAGARLPANICPPTGFYMKGQALVEKASARTDFSYVSGHLGKF